MPSLGNKRVEDGMDGIAKQVDDSATLTLALTDLAPLDPTALPPLPEPTTRPPRRTRQPRPRITRASRTVHLGVRVLPSERVRLAAEAKAAGYRDVSAWCRGTLLAACGGEAPPVLDETASRDLERLRRDLNSGVGSNLNQALAHANVHAKAGRLVNLDVLLAAVAAAQVALEALRGDLGKVLGPRGRA